MKRIPILFALALVLGAAPLGAQTATPTPTRTPTPTSTPVQGANLGAWDACARATTPKVSTDCGYFTQGNFPQAAGERWNFAFSGGSNACVYVWQSLDEGANKKNLSGCLVTTTTYSMPACGNCQVGIGIGTTPTPNATPLSVWVRPSHTSIKVFAGTPTPTPTP